MLFLGPIIGVLCTGMGQAGMGQAGMGQGLRTRVRCTFDRGVEERAMRVGNKLTCVRFAAELRPRRPAIPLPAEATEATEHACLARQHVRQFVPACGLVLE